MAQAFTNESTSDDLAKIVLTDKLASRARNLYISNTGANPALFTVDAGVTWRWLGASSERTLLGVNLSSVQIKNEGAGNDLTNIDGDVW